jgi:hypothetical protein
VYPLVKSEKHGLTAPFFICVEFCKNEKLINEKGTFCHKFPHFLGKGKIIPISEYFWKLFGHISTFGGGGEGQRAFCLPAFVHFGQAIQTCHHLMLNPSWDPRM